jgi:hypothetical protein
LAGASNCGPENAEDKKHSTTCAAPVSVTSGAAGVRVPGRLSSPKAAPRSAEPCPMCAKSMLKKIDASRLPPAGLVPIQFA